MIIYTPAEPARAVPIINLVDTDISDAARDSAAQAIHRACRETGFFYIANHGVPAELVSRQFAAAQALFDLPFEEKMRLDMRRSPTTAGYEPIGGQALDSQDDQSEKAPPDLKESFYCGRELPDEHPLLEKKLRGLGYNQWPENLPGFRAQTIAYYKSMCALGDRLLALIARSLGLDDSWFAPFYEHSSAMLRLIKYPPHPQNAQPNQIGAGAHTDWGGITILAQDSSGGLEVETVSGQWLAAPPVPDTFVINLGDLMARWTNGVYNSNMHRVKNNVSGGDRYSLPFFYSPRNDALIEPIPTCVTPEHPRRFEACTCAEHMSEMFLRSYGYAPRAA